MALYFNYKTPFDTLTGKFTKKIEANSILDWFQKIWKTDLGEKDLYEYYKREFGTHFYGLGQFAYNISGNEYEKPITIDDLLEAIRENFYVNEIRLLDNKFLEILTDDDEYSLAWYLIEEEYAKSDLNRFAYLMYEGWKLPLSFSEKETKRLNFEFKQIITPKKKRKGELYFLSICNDAGDGPIDYYPMKFTGIRLTDLEEYLMKDQFDNELLPLILTFFKSKLNLYDRDTGFVNQIIEISSSLSDLYKLFHYHVDLDLDRICISNESARKEFEKAFETLSEKKKELFDSGRSDLNKIQDVVINGNDHFVQISIQGDYWEGHPVDPEIKNSKVYDQIFLFDDLWVNENYELANSLINYYTNWQL